MSEEELILAGGRLGGAELPYDTRYLIIVPPRSRLSKSIIWDAHRAIMLGATQLMMQYIRNNYWIPRLREELHNFTTRCTAPIVFVIGKGSCSN